jgi:hypothetical protein
LGDELRKEGRDWCLASFDDFGHVIDLDGVGLIGEVDLTSADRRRCHGINFLMSVLRMKETFWGMSSEKKAGIGLWQGSMALVMQRQCVRPCSDERPFLSGNG